MKVKIEVYDGIKYKDSSKVIATCYYDIARYEVRDIPEDEILETFDETDECDEYLILTLADGETATFRNSHVDMFGL